MRSRHQFINKMSKQTTLLYETFYLVTRKYKLYQCYLCVTLSLYDYFIITYRGYIF